MKVLITGGNGFIGSNLLEALLNLNQQPLVIYSLEVLSKIPEIKEIIVVANPQNSASLRRMIRKNKYAR